MTASPENDKSTTIVLLATSLTAFLTPFTTTSINVALPLIGQEFNADALLLSWISTAHVIAAATFLIPFGRMADIYGRKRIYILGTAIFTIASILLMLSNSAITLIIFRVLQGIGNSMIFGTGVAILTSVFPSKEKGKALGIQSAAVFIGASSGPVIGGLLTQYLGWRSIFWINIPLGLLVLYLMVFKLKGEWAEAKGEKFDFVGSLVYSLTIIFIMYSFTSMPSISAFGFLGAGLLGIFIFTKWEGKIANPILNFSQFKSNKTFIFSSIATLLNFSAINAVAFLLSLYLQYAKGLSPRDTGLVLIVQPVIIALISPFAGRISDKIEPRILASTGMAIICLSLIFLTFLSGETSLILIIAALLIMGVGIALFNSPNTYAVINSVDRKVYGMASSVLSTMRMSGNALSMAIVMLIFSIFIGRVQIGVENIPVFLQSIRVLFIIFAAFCLTGVFASLARGKIR